MNFLFYQRAHGELHMKRLFWAAIVSMAASAPACAQSSTMTGNGVGFSRSASAAQAISGQGGTAKIISNSTVPADQTVRNVPSVGAPGLASRSGQCFAARG